MAGGLVGNQGDTWAFVELQGDGLGFFFYGPTVMVFAIW